MTSTRHILHPHPDHPPHSVRAVEVELKRSSDRFLTLWYSVQPAEALVLPDHGFARLDGLWRTTCFEFFIKSVDEAAYREFNFASVGGWAAYSFTDWRVGMTPLKLATEPHLVDCRLDGRSDILPDRYELDITLGSDALPGEPTIASLTAVIEETSGHKSYWALAHPPSGPPDFHHPDCFVLELPPAIAP